jgi:gas vesicle protein
MNSGKIMLGALGGFVTGAIVGMIFAPDKGSESREKIIEKGEDYLESIKDRFNMILDNISGRFDGGRMETVHAGKNGKVKSKPAKASAQ